MRRTAIACASFIAMAAIALPAQAKKCPTASAAAVADTMTALFSAMRTDDMQALGRILDPDFYAYDVGKRYDARQLASLMKAAHAAGKIYEWNVTQPDVHFACDTAWIAYVNQGATGDASGMHPQTWLESATLRYEGGLWRVLFLNSARVPAPAT